MADIVERTQLYGQTIRHDAQAALSLTPLTPVTDVFRWDIPGGYVVPLVDAGPWLTYNLLVPGSLNLDSGPHSGRLVGLGIILWFDLLGFSDPDASFHPLIGLAWPNADSLYQGDMFNPIGQSPLMGWGVGLASSFASGPRPSGVVQLHLEGTFPGGTGIGGGPIGGGVFVLTGWQVTTVREGR